MKYTFSRHDPIPGSIVFVLILDMKRKKERILIGNENYIELRLRGSEEDNIFYDRTAPLGSLLMNFHQDTDPGHGTNLASCLSGMPCTQTDGNNRSLRRWDLIF